jgi:hypothetical protein
MQDKTGSHHTDKVPTGLQKPTRKITAIVCADVASAIFVRILRTASLGVINTFGLSFQNVSGDTVANSILNLFHNLLQEL